LKELSNMLNKKPAYIMMLSTCLLAVTFSMTGCSALPFLNPATATPTAIPATNTPLPSATPIPPTATPLPTSTATPTATPLPPLAVAPDGINPWCLPITFGSIKEGPNGPASMPDGARPGSVDKTTGRINFHIPAIECTLVIAFNQPIPTGMKLQVWDARPQEPFITYEILVNPINSREGYAKMNHAYIVNPPKWWLDYTMVVVTADGKEVLRSPVRVFKSLPEKCWDDSLPDPITLFCPIQDS
jgi:hypothetical protein